MSTTKHSQAGGIHPGAFVQADPPNTSDVQDGVLWLDTSSGPPYVLRVWNATGAAGWEVVQMDATGYPLPGGARLDAQIAAGPASNGSIHLWDARDGPLTWIDATTYGLAAGAPVTIGTQIDLRGVPLTLAALALAVPTPIPDAAQFTFAVYDVPSMNQEPVQIARVGAGPEIAQQSIGYNGWPGVVLPSPVTLDNLYGWYIIIVEIVGSQWGRAADYYGYNDYIDSSNYYFQSSPNLSDPGFDPANFTGASNDSATGIDVDASYTAPVVLRLVQPDGTVDWTHDGVTCRTKSNGSDVLVTPFSGTPQLGQPLVAASGPGGVLVPGWGRFPAAYVNVAIPPTPPVPPPVGTNQDVQMRCGAAQSLTTHLLSLYQQWADELTPALTVVGEVGLVAFLVAFIDPMYDVAIAGAAAAGIYSVIRSLLLDLAAAAGGSAFLTPTADAQTAIHKACFCQLTVSGGVVQVTQAAIAAWRGALPANLGEPGTLTQQLLDALLAYTPLQDWQTAAQGAVASSACDDWTCP